LASNFHAGAVLLADRGVLVAGPSGAGKTALCLTLLDQARLHGYAARLVRNDNPVLLVEADATDPAAPPPLSPRVDVRVQRRYNPEGITQYNVVPGLLGVILTMTMVLMTGLALTRERERGTYENLLATPVRPIEVMTGKVVPYILIGLLQVALVLAGARYVFGVPFLGSLVLLFFVVLLFIAANLTLGITFSSLARNQLQAMQMTFFYFLPSILLSGFMFPFRGMPGWAQWIGNLLPLTHFLVLVRGILLKGNGVTELWPAIWPIAAFTVAAITVGVTFYRRTLD